MIKLACLCYSFVKIISMIIQSCAEIVVINRNVGIIIFTFNCFFILQGLLYENNYNFLF